MNLIRRGIALLTALIITASLAACGAEKKGFTPSLDTDTACEIRVAGSYENFEAIEEEFKRFNEYYPNVEFSYTYVDDYRNNIQAVLAGDDAPNIYMEYSDLQVSPLVLSDESLGLDFSSIREGLIYHNEDGDVTMIPIFANTYGMLVNEDLFKEYDLEIPTTFTELLACCEAFLAAGFDSPIMTCYNWSYYTNLATAAICKAIAGSDENAAKLNERTNESGEMIRGVLENLQTLSAAGSIDIDLCAAQISDGYNAVIMRFFEGNVPMMLCTAETVSGTEKREERSEKFSADPFTYSFHSVPVSDGAATYYDMSFGDLAINKNCDNMDMTVEFIKFLLTTEELNIMAEIKGSLTVTKDLSFDSKYASFADISMENAVSAQDGTVQQDTIDEVYWAIRLVMEGVNSIDEVIENFGTLCPDTEE